MFRESWDSKYNSEIGEHTDSPRTSMKLFNGKEVTREYIQMGYKNEPRFGAFERCINYRKDKGEEWFFGALGEAMTMLDNAIYLNAAHKITGLGFIINTDYWYWSCSESSSRCSWGCYLRKHRVYYYWDFKHYTGSIVPFYASTNEGLPKDN